MLDQAQTRLLTEGARHLGVELSNKDLARLFVYLEEIQRWSKIADLISQVDPEITIRKHILDSLALSPLIPSDCCLLDLGSGAGFPGVVLAIVAPARNVVLVEARRKRVSFLKEVARRAKLGNVHVLEGRVETWALEESLRARFAVVVTRATWSLQNFLQFARPFVADEGSAVAMKGLQVEKELSDCADSLHQLGFRLQNRYRYTLPYGGEKREAVIFAKACFT